MRTFEILLLATLLPAFVGLYVPGRSRPPWLYYSVGLGALFMVLHWVIEGYRWQMVPAYVLTAAFTLAWVRTLANRDRMRSVAPPPLPPSRWRTAFRMTAASLGLVMLGLAAAIPAAMPVFELPEPTGQFRVGTTRFSMRDASRPETFTADPDDKRELLIQAWYPAEPRAKSAAEPLWGYPQEIAPRMTRSLGLPRFLFDHFNLIRTHSYRDAPLASSHSTYPVLVFSHGYSPGIPPQNTVQMEELASHGYIVFSIGHSYESLVLIHPDGRIITVSEERVQRVREQMAGAGALSQQLFTTQDSEERARLLQRNSEATPLLNESLRIWTTDTRFVLDELGRRNATQVPPSLADRLDMTRVGIFGMSFGGTTATEVCLIDSRCRAGINLDGLQYGAAASAQSTLAVPFMFMSSEPSGLMNEPVFRRAQSDAWYLVVIGSTHFDYSDFSLISPIFPKLGLLGPIGGRRMEAIMSAYVRAFFDRHLGGQASLLLNGASSKFPEVQFQQHAAARPAQENGQHSAMGSPP